MRVENYEKGVERMNQMSKRMSRLFLAALVIGLVGASGCAKTPGTFDRTQPNKLEKSLFAGKWYYVPTTIEIPSAGAFTFVGEMAFGNTPLIMWDIQKDHLVGYKVVETVKGAEKGWRLSRVRNYWDKAKLGEFVDVYIGSAVAAYKITSHFDVIRDYNVSTGEQNNILVENTTDKPWYLRKYIRVDWSQNVITNYSFLSGGVETTSLEYYVPENEKNNPDAPEVTSTYIDIVGKVYGTPMSTGSCSTYYVAGGDCAPVTIKIRHSFRKYDEKTDYQALDYNDVPMDKFGFFRTERYGYDTDWGHTEVGRDYKINRWNLWAKSCAEFEKDATGVEKKTDEGLLICKKWMPYSERPLKPIIYWTSPYLPSELEADTFATAEAWDKVFKRTVAWMRYLEKFNALSTKRCTSNTECGEQGQCLTDSYGAGRCYVPNPKLSETDEVYKQLRADLDKDNTRLFVLCRNPSIEGLDHAECLKAERKPKVVKKIGDLRYPMMYWIPDQQASSPLGYGPSAADPRTGEIFWASAYIYGAPLETYAQLSKDIVDLINGKLDTTTLYTGRNVQAYIQSLQQQGLLSGLTNGLSIKVDAKTGKQEWETRYKNVYNPPKMNYREMLFPGKTSLTREDFRKKIESLGVRRVTSEWVTSRLEKIKGTELEDMLINNEVIRGFNGFDPNAPFSTSYDPSLKDKLSPTNWMNPVKIGEKKRMDMVFMKNNVYKADFIDDSIAGLAKDFAARGIEGKDLYYGVLKAIYLGVLEHEVGHTIGLRHNFAGSADTLNYFDQFYALKAEQTNTGQLVLQPRCRNAIDTQTNQEVFKCFPMSTKESDGRLTEYQYSTVMDYGAKFNSDIHSLGKYDYASIMFGYGGLIETYKKIRSTNSSDKNTDDLRYAWTSGLINHPYQPVNETIGVSNNLVRSVGSYDMSKLEQDNFPVAQWSYIQVPYRFMSDEYRGNLGANTWDQGVDSYEVVENAVNNLKFYYLFDAFKRDRYGFGLYGSASSYFSRILDRYFGLMGIPSRYWALFSVFTSPATFKAWASDPWGGGSMHQSATLALKYISQSLFSPAPGCHKLDATTNQYVNVGYDTPKDQCQGLYVPVSQGKFPYTTYNKDAGYFYFTHALYVGSFWEKLAALMTLTDSTAYFVGETFSELGGGTSLGFATVAQKEIMNLIAGVVLNDPTKGAGVVRNGQYEPRDPFADPSTYNGLPTVQPSITSLDMKLYTIVYSMAFLPAGFDQGFIDTMQLFVKGKLESHQIDPSLETTEFKDPFSGQSWIAVKAPFADRTPVAFELLKQAQTLADKYNAATGIEKSELMVELKSKLEVIHYMGLAYDALGELTF